MTMIDRLAGVAARGARSRLAPWGRAALAVTLAVTLLPSVGLANGDPYEGSTHRPAAQDRPDLKIEYAGFTGSDQLRIKFKVTNVGKARSSSGLSVKVVTLDPAPTREVNLPLSPLQPGASNNEATNPLVYTLAGLCNNGLPVRASVDDQPDLNIANDKVEVLVCPPITPESPPDDTRLNPSQGASIRPPLNPASVEVGPSAIPEHLQRGEHTLDVETSEVYRHALLRINEGVFGCSSEIYPDDVSDTNVGFNYEDWIGCEFSHVQQLIVTFDLDWLREMERKLIFGAELQYDEVNPVFHGDMEIHAQTANGRPTCIGRVGEAQQNWRRIVEARFLLSTEDVDGGPVAGGWNITREVQESFLAGAELHSFVLHGLSEDLDAEMGAQMCRSRVETVRLKLHYAIL